MVHTDGYVYILTCSCLKEVHNLAGRQSYCNSMFGCLAHSMPLVSVLWRLNPNGKQITDSLAQGTKK